MNTFPEAPPPTTLTAAERRAAIALAEAVIPTSFGIPGADERTLTQAEVFLRTFGGPWITKLWGSVARLVDTAAILRTGRRFQSLNSEQQQKLIEAWHHDPVLGAPMHMFGFFLKFAHFDAEHVVKAVNGKRHLSVVEPQRWTEQVIPAHKWTDDVDIECDVVVVGTGAGGAVVGDALAAQGHAVLFVEEGKHHQRDDFTGSSVHSFKNHYRKQTFAVGNNFIPVFAGKMFGGSTALNTGTCFRTPDRILDDWCEMLNTDEFSPANMSRFFDAVETELQVTEANPKAIGPFGDFIKRGAEQLGWSHFAVRRNAPDCMGDGFCQFGCPTDARRSTNVSYMPNALQKGAMCITGLHADGLRMENGRAVGVDAVSTADGRRFRIRAQAVVFCGGAIPTPLFLSRQGLCNESGELGRNLSLHPSAGMMGITPEPMNPNDSIPQGYGCDEFHDDGLMFMGAIASKNLLPLMTALNGHRFNELMSHHDNIAAVGVLAEDEKPNGRVWWDVDELAVITYNLTQGDVDRLHRGMVGAAELFMAGGCERVFPSVHGWGELRSRDDLERFRRAKLRSQQIMLTSYHPLGTCKMGNDPRTSVVDTNHETHEVPGLFIVDGSTVPSPPSVNPQITIMAMATRAAEKIGERLR